MSLNTLWRRIRWWISNLSSDRQIADRSWTSLIDHWKAAHAGDGTPSPVVLQVGSSGGSRDRWTYALENKVVQAIELDLADWGNTPAPQNVTRILAAVGEKDASRNVYLTRHPACSSCLPPNKELLADYPVANWFEVIDVQELQTRRFDSLSAEHDLPAIQFVRLDVQGFEQEVLLGMGDHLKSVVALELECQLKPLYQGQTTFDGLYRWMNEQGFLLRDLKPQGPFEGEVVEMNSFWIRKQTNSEQQDLIRLWEIVSNVFPAIYFADADAHQRRKYGF